MKTLETVANEIKVPSLWTFYSETHAESFASIGEELPEEIEEVSLEWTSPHSGLITVDALLGYINNHPESDDWGERKADVVIRSAKREAVVADLESLLAILATAQKHAAMFRLRIDV